MDVNQLENKLRDYIEEPRTAYQLCADTGVGFSTMLTYLKILEAAGKVVRIRGKKSTLWKLTNPSPPRQAGNGGAGANTKHSHDANRDSDAEPASVLILEDGEVEQ